MIDYIVILKYFYIWGSTYIFEALSNKNVNTDIWPCSGIFGCKYSPKYIFAYFVEMKLAILAWKQKPL